MRGLGYQARYLGLCDVQNGMLKYLLVGLAFCESSPTDVIGALYLFVRSCVCFKPSNASSVMLLPRSTLPHLGYPFRFERV